MKKIQLFQNPGKSRKVFKHTHIYILKAFSINLKSILDNNQNPVFCGPQSEKLSLEHFSFGQCI